MDKAEVCYFSGTGNSLAVARDIARKINGELISIASVIDKETIKTYGDKIEDLRFQESIQLMDHGFNCDDKCISCSIFQRFALSRI